MSFENEIRACERVLSLPADGELLQRWARDEAAAAAEPFAVLLRSLQAILLVRPDLARRAVEHVRSALDEDLDPVDRARLARLHAHALRTNGELESASARYEDAWRMFTDADPSQLAATAIGWVQVLAMLGQVDDALELERAARPHLRHADALAPARLQTNLANALVHAGRHREAQSRYQRARRRFQRAGAEVEASFCANGLGRVFLHLGRVDRARPLFAEAERVLAASGHRVMQLYAQAGLANADLLEGKWEEGLQRLGALREDFDALADLRASTELRRESAQLLAGLGAVEAARREARRALEIADQLGAANDAARLAFLLGQIEVDLGSHRDAVFHLQRAERRWTEEGSERRRRRAQMEMARVELAEGGGAQAARRLARLQTQFDRDGSRADAVSCRVLRAEWLLRRGRAEPAVELLREARRRSTRNPARMARPRIALGLARAEAVRGDRRAALRWARKSVDELEEQLLRFGTRPLRELTAGARDRLYPAAVELVLEHGGSTAERRALDLLSRARSPRLIEDLLQGSRAPRDEKLRLAMRQLRDRLLGTGDDDEGLRSAAALEIDALEHRVGEGLRRSPGVLRRALGLRAFEAWERRLGARTLVFFHAGPQGWSAFVVAPGVGVRHVRLPEVDAMLRRLWPPLRLLFETAAQAPAERRDRFLDRSGDEAERTLRALYDAVLAPLELEDTPLVLVPDADLHALPLEAAQLVGAGPAAAGSVSRLPHPALLRAQRPRVPRRRALLVKGPESGPAREVRRLSRTLRERGFEVEIGERRGDLEAARPPVGLVHVATHGSFHREGWLLSGLRLRDGWAGFEHLDPRWVRDSLLFFASCESGLAGRVPGSDLEGWLTAGLGAGAREMVLTLWKVDDEATLAYSEPFYRHWLEGADAPSAAALTRRALRESGAHAYRWAPFFAVG